MTFTLIAIVGFALVLAALRRQIAPEGERIPIRVDNQPRQ